MTLAYPPTPIYPNLSAQNLQPVPFYCEENIWQLCAHDCLENQIAKVIFISNQERQCPIWHMKAAIDHSQPVIWDYHVILVSQNPLLVWDFDTLLGFPIDFSAYFKWSFFSQAPDPFQPLFKVIDRDDYRTYFASDRSHMRKHDQWQAPPPEWPVIGEGKTSNLSHYWDMSSTQQGTVLTLNQLYQYFGCPLQA